MRNPKHLVLSQRKSRCSLHTFNTFCTRNQAADKNILWRKQILFAALMTPTGCLTLKSLPAVSELECRVSCPVRSCGARRPRWPHDIMGHSQMSAHREWEKAVWGASTAKAPLYERRIFMQSDDPRGFKSSSNAVENQFFITNEYWQPIKDLIKHFQSQTDPLRSPTVASPLSPKSALVLNTCIFNLNL